MAAIQKYASLFVRSGNGKENNFYNIYTCGQCYKTFLRLQVTTFHNKLERLSLLKPFQLSLMFVGKARDLTYSGGKLFRLGRLRP
jgi:hypothetical protein